MVLFNKHKVLCHADRNNALFSTLTWLYAVKFALIRPLLDRNISSIKWNISTQEEGGHLERQSIATGQKSQCSGCKTGRRRREEGEHLYSTTYNTPPPPPPLIPPASFLLLFFFGARFEQCSLLQTHLTQHHHQLSYLSYPIRHLILL